MSFSCKYRDRYFLSYFIVSIIIAIIFSFIYQFSGIDPSNANLIYAQGTCQSLFLLGHICYVLFSDYTQCRDDKCKACANSCGLTYPPSK
jgi:hypothetical protein